MATLGYYQSIETFALVDGPGVRAVLFLQGCNYRCLYCHNPDTWICSKNQPITPLDAFNKLYRYKTYWGKHGGITISGGEPLLQIDFLIEFAKICKEHNVHLTIDTAGGPFNKQDNIFMNKFNELLNYIDLIMLDLKAIDNDLHKKITGFYNDNIIDMFNYLSEKNFPIWIRHVLVPDYTLNDDYLIKASQFIKTLKNVDRVEILPYHNMAISKYEKLGIPYRLKDTRIPTDEEVKHAEKILEIDKYINYKKYS